MTTKRQKYAVRWVNELYKPYQFTIFAPEEFKPFDEKDIDNYDKVHEFLNKWLNRAKKEQHHIIAEKESLREEYYNWFNK